MDINRKTFIYAFSYILSACWREIGSSNLTFFYTSSKKILDKRLEFKTFRPFVEEKGLVALTKKLIKILPPEIIFYYCTIGNTIEQ